MWIYKKKSYVLCKGEIEYFYLFHFFFLVSQNVHSQQLKVGCSQRNNYSQPINSVSGGVGTSQNLLSKKKEELYVRAMVY